MARIDVDGDTLSIKFSRGERLLALRRSDVDIALTNIRSVRKVASPWTESGYGPPYYRKRGSFTPRYILGSWERRNGPSTFAAVKPHQPGYVIETSGEPYDIIVVSTPDVAALDARVDPTT